jgi:hypothetical protein
MESRDFNGGKVRERENRGREERLLMLEQKNRESEEEEAGEGSCH